MNQQKMDDINAVSNQSISCDDQEREKEANAVLSKGSASYEQGKKEEALSYYEKAIEINPKYFEAYKKKGNVLLDMGKKEEAIKEYDKALEINPHYVDALYNKGLVLQKLGSQEKALELYEQAININPQCGNAFYNKGIQVEALQCYDQAIEINPQHIIALVARGVMKFQLNQYDQALVDIKLAEKLMEDQKNLNDYSEGNINYIKTSVQKIIEIEQTLENQNIEIEKLDQNDEQVKEIKRKLETINEQIGKVYSKELDQIQDEKKKRSTPKDFDKIIQQLQMQQQLVDLLIKQNQENCSEIQELKIKQFEYGRKHDEQYQIIQVAGVYDAALIKRKFEQFQQEDPPLCLNYYQAFYWTTLNYFDSLRVASTGNLQVKIDEYTSEFVGLGVQTLGSMIPVIGTLMQLIKHAIQEIYKLKQEKMFKEKESALLNIICKYSDTDQTWSLALAKTSQEVAIFKKPYLGILETETKKGVCSSLKFKLRDLAAKENLNIYQTKEGQQAFIDATKILAYMEVNRELIISSQDPIDVLIVDIVKQQLADEMIKEIDKQGYQKQLLNKEDKKRDYCCLIQ